MAPPSIATAAAASSVQKGVLEQAKPRFSAQLSQGLLSAGTPARSEASPQRVSGSAAQPSVSKVSGGCPPLASTPASASVSMDRAASALDRVAGAQRRLDAVLKLAESGKTFTPGELLSFQAQVYRASQELDLAGKVVEKGTAGVKQVLQTQV